MPLGNTCDLYSCQAVDSDFLLYGVDGGVVNSLLNYMFEKKLIDGAVVAKTKAPFSKEPLIAKNKEELLNAAGLKLGVSHQLTEVQKIHSYSSSLPEIKRTKFKKLAVVGTPCQIYTIRCMQDLGIVPSQNIEFCLGLFCYENFEFDQNKMKQFEREFNIKFEDIEKIKIKKDLVIQLKGDEYRESLIHVPFEDLKKYMRPACNACSDFSNVYADVSFGGLGSPEDFTTVLTRTKKGRQLMTQAIRDGVIKSLDIDGATGRKIKDVLLRYAIAKMERKGYFVKTKLRSYNKAKSTV
jgi:coenzyme F420 hydrogenase subunit beta